MNNQVLSFSRPLFSIYIYIYIRKKEKREAFCLTTLGQDISSHRDREAMLKEMESFGAAASIRFVLGRLSVCVCVWGLHT